MIRVIRIFILSGLKIRKLKRGSVPTVFPNYPKYMTIKTPRKRKASEKDISNLPAKRTAGTTLSLVDKSSIQQIAQKPHEEPRASSSLPTVQDAQTEMDEKLINATRTISNLRVKVFRQNQKLQDQQDKLTEMETNLKNFEKVPFMKLQEIMNDSNEDCDNATFILDLVLNYKKQRPSWNPSTVRLCTVWNFSSPKGYNYPRKSKFLALPSKRTLKRYVGGIDGETGMTKLVKERLKAEASNLDPKEKFVSIIIDEMAINPKLIFDKKLDRVFGLKDTKKHIEAAYNHHEDPFNVTQDFKAKETVVANQLLSFVMSGISISFTIPAAYFFTRQTTGEDLHLLTNLVIREVEECGFFVVRIVTDNHKTNVAMMRRMAHGPRRPLEPSVQHPLDENRLLFLSFDPSHIIKNIRNQFLEFDSPDNSTDISGKYVIYLYEMQKNEPVKAVRNLTRKHVYPSNFEKMNVRRAIDIFSTPVIAAVEYLQKHSSSHPVAYKFRTAGSTVKYMKSVQKWFEIHNIANSKHAVQSRNENKSPFFSMDDERLEWLQTSFRDYMFDLQNVSQKYFLTRETFEAVMITSQSTVECVNYLLDQGFDCVLTRKLTGDAVEMFHCILRSMTGGNDMLDARATIFSVENILKKGTILAKKTTANVLPDSFSEMAPFLTESDFEENENATSITPPPLPHSVTCILDSLDSVQPTQRTTLKLASIASLAGYVIHLIEERNFCGFCVGNISQPCKSSPLLDLIKNADRGGLKYPIPSFSLVICTVVTFIEKAVPFFQNSPSICANITNYLEPKLEMCPVIQCELEDNHSSVIAKLICKKIIPPIVTNVTRNLSSKFEKTKTLDHKPLSRKVLKV